MDNDIVWMLDLFFVVYFVVGIIINEWLTMFL